MKTFLAAVALLTLAACGQAQGQGASTTASPTTPSPLLYAVLEAKGTQNAWTYNTVAIAGLDGQARATATFEPMPVPSLGCMGAILPPSAHVAAGKVFYADGKGVIRSLSADGTIATVATFPMTSAQQMLSFAVSPDGAHIIGTLFTAPKTAQLACSGSSSGTFAFDAYTVTGPTTTQLVYHQSSTTPPAKVLALIGWDALGPFGTYPTVWATQGGGPGSDLGVYVRVDATTLKPGAPFSDPGSCRVWNSVSSGAFVCLKDGAITNGGTAQQQVAVPVSVRRADGTELWRFTVSSANGAWSPVLAPDEQHVVVCCADVDSGSAYLLVGRDGSQVKLAKGFYGAAWLNATTLAGDFNTDPLKQPPFPLSYVGTTAPLAAVSMGLSGHVVASLS
jgi:hypothetical protein